MWMAREILQGLKLRQTIGQFTQNFSDSLTMTREAAKYKDYCGQEVRCWCWYLLEFPLCPVLERGYGQIGKHNGSRDHLIMKCCSGTIQKGTRLNPLNENIFDSKSTCSKLSYHWVKSPHAFIIKMQIIRWWEKEVFLVATPLSSCQGKQ